MAPKGVQAAQMHGTGDTPEYIDLIYNWAASNKYGCRYVCYFNLVDGGVLTTLDETPRALQQLKARAAQASAP